MNEYNIIELVDKLIGDIEPIGSSGYDDKAFERLPEHIELTTYLLGRLIETAQWKDRHEYSMKRSGERAYSEIKDICSWLSEYIEVGD